MKRADHHLSSISAGRFKSNGDDYAYVALDGARYPPPLDVLTTSEAEVVLWICSGRSNAEIGRARGRSERTVANQVKAVFRKLGVTSRRELLEHIRRVLTEP